MQSLFLKGTEFTPEFNYEVENFTIEISGESNIEKNNPFYISITEFISTIELAKPMRLNIEFKFSSICRSSKRGLLFFLLRLKELQVHCKTDIRINWHYPPKNSLVKIIGEDLEYMVMIPINTIESVITEVQEEELVTAL